MRRFGIVGFLSLLLIVGCGEPLIFGVILEKQWVPAHTETNYQHITIGETTMLIPYDTYVPDTYYITFGYDGRYRKARVEEYLYNKAIVGHYINIEQGVVTSHGEQENQ